MKRAGSKGQAKLTTRNFCHSGRRRKMNSEETDITAKKFRVKPM